MKQDAVGLLADPPRLSIAASVIGSTRLTAWTVELVVTRVA